MAFTAGQRVGSYEIAVPLGAGGIGKGYRAVTLVESWATESFK